MLRLKLSNIIILLLLGGLTPCFGQDFSGIWNGADRENGDQQGEYTIYLKNLAKNSYFGISEWKLRGRLLKKLITAEFVDTLTLNGRPIPQNKIFVSEFAPFSNKDSRDFVASNLVLTVVQSEHGLVMKMKTSTNNVKTEMRRTSQILPEIYENICPKNGAFTIDNLAYQNALGNQTMGYNETGLITLRLKHNFPTKQPFNIRIGAFFKNKYINTSYSWDPRKISSDPLQIELTKTRSGYGISEDSISFDISIGVENSQNIYVQKFTIPSVPFIRKKSVKMLRNAELHPITLSTYFGLQNKCCGNVIRTVDSLSAKGDSMAIMYKAVFEYFGKGGYYPDQATAIVDAKRAYNYIYTQARTGNAEALHLLYFAAEMNIGGDEIRSTSRFFLELASDGGLLPAKFDLAINRYVKKEFGSFEKSVADLNFCYENGLKKSATMLGLMYESGDPGEKNIQTALNWYDKGISIGDPQAMFRKAALFYDSGVQAVNINSNEALNLLKKSAQQNYNDAVIFLGYQYMSGENGISKNITEAIKLFEHSADMGYKEGMEALAIYYSSRQSSEIKKSKNTDLKWAEKAAQIGSGICMALLSKIYHEGLLVDQDELKARFWYNQAAENGFGEKIATKQVLGDFLLTLMNSQFYSSYYTHRYSNGLEKSIIGGTNTLKEISEGLVRFFTNGALSFQVPVNNFKLIYETGKRAVYGGSISTWLKTGIYVKKNNIVLLKSYGRITVDLGTTTGPNGLTLHSTVERNIAFGFANHGAVIIGVKKLFYLGGAKSMINILDDGELEIGINDMDTQNNSGAFDIYLEIIQGE